MSVLASKEKDGVNSFCEIYCKISDFIECKKYPN